MTTQSPDPGTATDPSSELVQAPVEVSLPAAPRARVALLSLGGTIFMT